jgi:regulator of nucleoside diphosphate kinase
MAAQPTSTPASLASQPDSGLDATDQIIGCSEMREKAKNRRKPAISISKTDHDRLVRLASATADRMPAVSDELLSELDRARIVSDAVLPANVVRMGSTVEYHPDTGAPRTVSLVFPDEADIADGKISILTPIGTALLGLKPGQSITWQARDGRRHELTVLSVRQPRPAQRDQKPMPTLTEM